MFTKPTLHTRVDGSKYMLDVAEFTLQEGKVNTLLDLFNGVAETLTKYKDTKDRAKNPDYLRGVLQGKMTFIEESRANEIYESLKNFPLGERAKSRLVADSIDEIAGELYTDMEIYERNLSYSRNGMKKGISFADDLVITKGKEKCSVALREGFMEELRTSMTREISSSEIEDNETFRKAIQLLWSLADKGYYLADGFAVSYDGQPIFTPSIIDKLMKKDVVNNPDGRDSLISDEKLFNSLKISNI